MKSLLPLTAFLLSVGFNLPADAQAIRTRPPRPAIAPDSAPAADANKPTEETAVDVPRPAAPPLGPRHIRLRLLDGSVISGDLSVSEISVETDFGKLVVPIDRIRRLTPGLDSNTKLSQRIETLIKNLASDDYQTREQAHKDLAALGRKAQKELQRFVSDDNAEIKRHVGEILKEIEEQAEERDDDEDATFEQPWIRPDTVVTSDFTVLGKVSPKEFKIESKYGPLTIQLADVKQGERETAARESFRKTVTVEGTNLAQRSFKSTGLKVQAGDKISLKADGSLVMSPWGGNSSSGPDGAANYGWYIPNQIPGGALVARVGEKGTIFKVGRQLNFVAKNSGVLQLAIGMQAEYANEHYAFPGQYSVKLRVDPK
ncbi:MAG TPA: hypothetical protein VKH44_08755 [Pirellulaceae bacterium]|nr:hypothetical protein [Pirellulaceae bacterium]